MPGHRRTLREVVYGMVNRFAMRRQQLLNLFASELVNYAENYYCSLLEAIKRGALGGAIVYAQTKPRNS
jgi:hypothetical protein